VTLGALSVFLVALCHFARSCAIADHVVKSVEMSLALRALVSVCACVYVCVSHLHVMRDSFG
jgi:hypothetical protein